LEVKESDSEFTVRAEVPGFAAKDLEIKAEPRRLSIAGKRETKEEEKESRTIRSERCADQILQTIDLPTDVDATKVSARLKDGILTLNLPKVPSAKAIRIEPKTA
jgi:HSP20 family protein